MPLYKKAAKNQGKTNQGNQVPPGSAGNIKTVDVSRGAANPPVNSKRGRNKAIGR